jgi:hypothetical protein
MDTVKTPVADTSAGRSGARERRRRLVTGVALGLGALAAAALLAEITLRAIGYRMPVLLPDSIRAEYGVGPRGRFAYFGYLPGEVEDFANPVELNNLGFHDRDYAPERPSATTYRIMVLGDSYVAAWEVPCQEIFHKRLEARLNKEDPLGRGSYQVIAFGQGRSAQEREIEWMREFAPIYRPDMILLLFFCGNDFMENDPATFADASRFGERYIAKVVPRKIRFFEKLLLFPHLRLNGLFAEGMTKFYVEHMDHFDRAVSRADLESPELGLYRNPLSPDYAAALDRTGKLLDVARKESARFHARFVLAGLSGPQAIGELAEKRLWQQKEDPAWDYQRGARWIRAWAESHRVPYLELGPSLAKAGRRQVFWKHDQHLNSYGHAIVADLLYPFLIGVAADGGRPAR